MKEKKKYPAEMLWNAEKWSEDFAADFPKPDNNICNKIFEEARSRTVCKNKPGKQQQGFRFLHFRWVSYAICGCAISILLLTFFWLNINNRKSAPIKQLNVQKLFKNEKAVLTAKKNPQSFLIVEQCDVADFDERIFDLKQKIVKQQLACVADDILNDY